MRISSKGVLARCTFCTEPPAGEEAVLKWTGEDRTRSTIPLCLRHKQRLAKAGAKGWEHRGFHYKLGWW